MMRVSRAQSYYFGFGILVALASFYACYRLSESPPTWFDEGIYVQVAQSLKQHGTQAVQTAPGVFASTAHVTGGYPFLAPIAASIKLLGNSLFAARVPMTLFIVLCVLAAWLLIYKLYGARDALFAMLLLSTFPLLYGNGKNVLGEVPGMFYLLLALYFVWQIEQHSFRGAKWYILAGIFVGLASATKPIFFLLPASIGIVFLCNIRRIPWRWQDVFVCAVASIAPLLLWAYLQFGSADALSSVLFHYANPYAETSIVHTALQNLLRFFTEATPLYCVGLMGVWVIACGVRMYRKQSINLAEWVAFVFSILILLAYVRTEGWYRYFFEAMILALVFFPSTLRVVVEELKKYIAWIKLEWCVAVPVLLLAVIQLYQLNYSSWVADHYASKQTSTLEAYFSSHTLEGKILVYNAPEVVPFLHSSNYYQYFDIEPTGATAYGKDNLLLLSNKELDAVILSPSMYQQHIDLFDGYTQSDTIGGYFLLRSK